MSRDLSGTNLRSAIDTDGSYWMLTKIEISPSRIFFSDLTNDSSGSAGDEKGVPLSPVKQDLEVSPEDDLLYTFYVQEGNNHLCYMIQGSSAIHDTGLVSTGKPGVLGSTVCLSNGSTATIYSLNWSTMNFSSLTSEVTSGSICANHVVADDGIMAITDSDGGFRPVYIYSSGSGASRTEAPQRFMFPTLVISSGSGRSMEDMGMSSGAARLGNKIFAYISNVQNGYVEGIYYDLDTHCWSDIFTALPTDLAVSQCEFKITNIYTRNSTLYMCGQFNRLDNLTGSQPYTLILQSPDGRTFSLDRHTLVSNIGYRFLARTGNDKLYLSNCNRVCYNNLTWVFDGATGTSGSTLYIPADDIKSINDQNLDRIGVVLKSGLEQYFDHPQIIEGSRMRAYFGMKTASGDEYVKWGTYIIDDIQNARSNNRKNNVIRAQNESMWKLSGLTMPFYAELLGKSVYFDPMSGDATELTTASPSGKTVSKFYVDMWKQEPYTNNARSITGINMIDSGGVNFNTSGSAGEHHFGIITNADVADICLMDKNPLITSGSVCMNVHGWSHPSIDGNNDWISIVFVTVDENNNETYHFSKDNTSGSGQWKITWPDFHNRPEPLELWMTGLTIGHRIKKVGMLIECLTGTWFNVARVDFMSGAEATYTYDDSETSWTKETDGTFTVPRAGRPFIMYGQRPYHTANFSLAASFNNSIASESCIANYPVGCGLIGFAEDGSNYILARYNRTNNMAELVKCRNGIETVTSGSTVGFTVQSDHIIRFDHKGGRFTMYLVNGTSGSALGAFEKVLEYEWKASDGYIFTNPNTTMKCGIYGNVSTPSVRTLGLYASMSEDTKMTDGLGIDPLDSHADFPESGTLRIGDDKFTYAAKIPHPTYRRGPYQLRQYGVYAPPWGNGSYGLECRDFDWVADEGLINGKLICISTGAVFKCSGADWTIYTSTGGVMETRNNRARYYSQNQQIGKSYFTLANKVWVVGGFDNIQQANPTTRVMHHMEGDIAYYDLEGKLKCYWYMGAGGNDDTTVEDLITQVCDLAAARANFPGDVVANSINTSGSYLLADVEYADGLDISFETSSNPSFELVSNTTVDMTNYESSGSQFITNELHLTVNRSGDFIYDIVGMPTQYRFYKCRFPAPGYTQKFRILYHLNNLSLYQNGQWVTTVAFDKITYGNRLTIALLGSLTINNLRIKELSDWREAVYIDLETDGRSALGSIIQQRVVEIVPMPDGSIDFYYEIDRDQIDAAREPKDHNYVRTIPSEGASDAIVQGWYEVKTMQHPEFARDLGLATRLMRMPDLTSGAYKAANLSLKKIYEGYKRHNFSTRPDLALIIGDLYHFQYTDFSTKKVIDKTIIVESVVTDLSMSAGKKTGSMLISGREKPV